jgi:hypothetical protein
VRGSTAASGNLAEPNPASTTEKRAGADDDDCKIKGGTFTVYSYANSVTKTNTTGTNSVYVFNCISERFSVHLHADGTAPLTAQGSRHDRNADEFSEHGRLKITFAIGANIWFR